MSKLRTSVLHTCYIKRIHVDVFMMNGFKIKGHITDFDDDVIVLTQADGKQMIIPMSAISTITPERPLTTE